VSASHQCQIDRNEVERIHKLLAEFGIELIILGKLYKFIIIFYYTYYI